MIRNVQRALKDKKRRLQNEAAERPEASSSNFTNNVRRKVRTAVDEERTTELQGIRDQIDRLPSRAPSPQLPVEDQIRTLQSHARASRLEEAISNLALKMDSFQTQLNELKTSREKVRMTNNAIHQTQRNMDRILKPRYPQSEAWN